MALTAFQRYVCQLLAQNRIESGESYVAGGAALNEVLHAPRLSRDVDLFHDTEAALDASWQSDRRSLEAAGLSVRTVRERAAFVEAEVSSSDGAVLLQWVRDSAYRFFPLVTHQVFGLTLHPFDLATNKVLALVGRLEVRDWVDIVECSERLQPLGYLAWAACGKDQGFGPEAILSYAARNSHYSADEVSSLAFSEPAPIFSDLAARWRAILATAKELIALLPAEQIGKCVLGGDGQLFTGGVASLQSSLAKNELSFHAGHIRGAMPTVVGC